MCPSLIDASTSINNIDCATSPYMLLLQHHRRCCCNNVAMQGQRTIHKVSLEHVETPGVRVVGCERCWGGIGRPGLLHEPLVHGLPLRVAAHVSRHVARHVKHLLHSVTWPRSITVPVTVYFHISSANTQCQQSALFVTRILFLVKCPTLVILFEVYSVFSLTVKHHHKLKHGTVILAHI